MKTIYPIVLLLLLSGVVRAQDLGVVHGQARMFRLKDRHGDIEFIKLDTSVREKKPVFLFCQGSMPLPLFVQDPTYGTYLIGGGITNFDQKAIEKDYHFIVISMPHVPVTVPLANTNSSMCYIPDTTQPNVFAPEYERADYLENYVQRAEKVLKYLKKQPWVDRSRLVVAGHSQGAKIAAKLGAGDKSITHVGLFGANPFGRVDQYVRQARKQAEKGQMSWEQAEKAMQEQYDFLQEAHAAESAGRDEPTLRTWRTFSEVFYDDWLRIKGKVYVAYGTEDLAADLCDLVPLFFIQAGKEKQLTLKRYPGLEHNFFEINPATGRPDYEKGHWKEVMQGFLETTRSE